MKKILIIIGIVMVTGVIGYIATHSKHSANESDVMTVTVAYAEHVTYDGAQTFGAIVKSADEAIIAAQVGGEVRDFRINEGERVVKGQVIGRIVSNEFEAQYAQSQAALHIAQEQEKNARRHWDDLKSEERMQYKLETERMRAVVSENAAYVKKTRITAPFDGVVSSKYISDGATIMPGSAIVRIIGDKTGKEVLVDVPSRFGENLSIGESIVITYGHDTDHAQIIAIDPVADGQTRKITIHGRLAKDSSIPLGAFVDVRVETADRHDGQRIPISSLVRKYNDMFVYVVAEGIAHMQKVDVQEIGEDAAIVSGISDRDTVVVSGVHELFDGDRVTVVKEL